MTADDFLRLCEPNENYPREKPGSRRNRIRRMYDAYRAAYTAPTLLKLCYLAHDQNWSRRAAILQAAKDRDAGRPMIEVAELMEKKS